MGSAVQSYQNLNFARMALRAELSALSELVNDRRLDRYARQIEQALEQIAAVVTQISDDMEVLRQSSPMLLATIKSADPQEYKIVNYALRQLDYCFGYIENYGSASDFPKMLRGEFLKLLESMTDLHDFLWEYLAEMRWINPQLPATVDRRR